LISSLEQVVAALAIALLGLGIVGMANPWAILRVVGRWPGSRRRILHALARVAFGIAVASIAAQTRAPQAVYWLGVLCFASGLIALLLRPALFWAFVSWSLRQSSSVVRMQSALAAAVGGFLTWATLG
jgi:cytosine/uracil/thiamine/allantoin permease